MKFLKTQFENLTVYKGRVVKINRLNVILPVWNDENIEFQSSNRELIHLAIEDNSLRNSMRSGDFEKILMKIIANENNVSDIDKCRYEDWMVSHTSFDYSSWKFCTKNEQDKFIFEKKERLFECIGKNINITLDSYQAIKHQQSCFQENLYARNKVE